MSLRSIRAVQYLRMSTEHQRYSLANQQAAIAEYAAVEGLEVIRTYSDAGKSGLRLNGRLQLQKLLSDCLSPTRDFSTILVLDVSRWGRFQDPDQAAYYEYVCRGAGVRVAYVGETFTNDGGLVSSIVKHLKRVMAAEYSRELSEKVVRAKLQQARLGNRQGGRPGFGFHRLLISEDGLERRILRPGQLKGVHTDRVTTIPGPAEEQAIVRRIFKMFLREDGSFAGIARQLNAEGIFGGSGRSWNGKLVAALIRNELCVGTYTYNRANRRLKAPTVWTSPKEWVKVVVTTPTVDRVVFAKANRLAGRPRPIYSDRRLLSDLKRHLKRFGRISPKVMRTDPELASPRTYEDRFGSIRGACERIGYQYQGKRRWHDEIHSYWTDETIIAAVRRCYAERGEVSAKLLNTDPSLPGVHVVQTRFGGLIPCYEAAGVPLTEAQLYWQLAPMNAMVRDANSSRPAA
jgi:DNA invertase Pin-like site-specific DNA recombinase